MTDISRLGNGQQQNMPVKMTIKKGQGLTQALFDLVKSQNMQISDGKITAKEWNATIDKLIEIQENRKANGGKSIFSGGINKQDYRGSFIVHPNQEIEFTADEMNSLYETMGVKLSDNAQADEPAQPAQPAQPEQPVQTAQLSQPEQSVTVPQSQTDLRPKTDITKAQNELIKQGYKLHNNPDGSKSFVKGNERVDFLNQSDGSIKRISSSNGEPIQATVTDKEGHIVSRSEFRRGVESGNLIETRKNYFPDGSIEKISFVNGERFDDFEDGDMPEMGELQFKFLKNSPLQFNSKFPTEAELLKAGYKKDTNIITGNGGAIYHNEKTGETVIISEFDKTCEYQKGNVKQTQYYDENGICVGGGISVKGDNGKFANYAYERDDTSGDLGVTAVITHPACETPAELASDALDGHFRNIEQFNEELGIPKDLHFPDEIKEGKSEVLSKDGQYKLTIIVDGAGNMNCTYSSKQPDGSFGEIGQISLLKQESPGSLRGYDYSFRSYNAGTGAERVISGASWQDW